MHDRELPLGKSVAYDAGYNPDLLYPIARASGRQQLGLNADLPFHGWDIWNAYELSWLDPLGKPMVAWGEFWMPTESPNIIESKSFKLYLNSLNQHRFADIAELQMVLQRDLARCLGADLAVHIRGPEHWDAALSTPAGFCLDDLPVTIEHYQPAPQLLRLQSDRVVSELLFSRLLRSRCPVTGQPDWGSVQIQYTGAEIDKAGLLAYIVSFRQHQDFHEQCVERIFLDISQRCMPQQLTVYARYLRRGGLDINPYRSSSTERPFNLRCFRQ